MRRRTALRLAGIGLLLLGGAAVLLLVLVHLPPVQRAAWSRAVRFIEGSTGWQVDAEQVHASLLWGGALDMHGLRAGIGGTTAVAADRVAIRFRWRDLLRSPPRLAAVEVDGIAVDLRNLELPERPPESEDEAVDPLRALEIGRLRVRGIKVAGSAADVDLVVDDAALSASLEHGTAEVAATIGTVVAGRAGRMLELGPVELEASAGGGRLQVRHLDVSGTDLSATLTLDADIEARRADGDAALEADIRSLASWYDPSLVALAEPRGRLRLEGGGHVDLDGGTAVVFDHVGGPLELAGYPIERLRLAASADSVRLEAGAAAWGELTADLEQDEARISADLDGVPVGPALALASLPVPPWLPGPMRLSGTVDATAPLPPDPAAIEARADLRLAFPEGRVRLRGSGGGGAWRADQLEVTVPGARLDGQGRIEESGALRARLSAGVSDPAALASYLGRWLPEAAALGVAGGPAELELGVAGSLHRPALELSFAWQQPEVAGLSVERVEGHAEGGLNGVSWRVAAVPAPGAFIEAEGTADPLKAAAAGTWSAQIGELAEIAALADEALAGRLGGQLEGGGSFSLSEGRWDARASVRAEAIRFDDWRVASATVDLGIEPERLSVDRIEAELLGGTVTGSAAVGLAGAVRPLQADIDWQGLRSEELPIAVPGGLGGALDGSLRLTGTAERPEGEAVLRWAAEQPGAVARAVALHVSLAGGAVRVASEGVDTAAGPLALTASLPLGDLPRPEWLWPDAPGGVLELTMAGTALDLTAVAGALGREPPPVRVTSDLSVDLRWSPADAEDRHGRLLLEGLEMRHPAGVITAPDGISVRLDGGVFVLERTRLVGPRAVVQVAGELDPETLDIRLEVDGQLSPEIAQVIPYPVRVREPITIRASVAGPLAAPEGTVALDHRGGTVVLRNPPVELTDLHLAASLSGGALWIDDGSAGVNRGEVQIGGGWDPASGQGLVVELENVTFFAAGTLTSWSGLLAIEPDPGATARIAGDLVLDGGVWDQPADIAGAFLSGTEIGLAADDPLRGIALDLTARARTGIRVDNNLGHFNVRWDQLRVGGSAAQPLLRGEVRIAPGGVVNLPGKRVELQRGTIRFTGDPAVDPVLELIPVENLAIYGGVSGDHSGIDTYTLAAQTLYGGIGRALGFENETLQPAQIAVETETDLSSQFLLGQRLSPNLAFFFATNPTDVQDRTTMLQLWNLDFNPGLAVQVYQKTLEERSGVTALQRLQWGGSAGRVGLPFSRGASATADRPIIHKIRFEGDWPISQRQLRRASGLRRGLPYEPFLDFVAEVHLEQRLAAEGFPEAEVRSRVEGSERSPTIIFSVDTGPYHHIEFAGDVPPARVQREVRALYMPPPLESLAIDNMRAILLRHYRGAGFPFASVDAERQGDRLILAIARGEPLAYRGPVVEGVQERGARLIRDVLGSPAELAAAVDDPDRAGRVVASVMAGIGYTDARLLQVVAQPVDKATADVRFVVDSGDLARVAAVEINGQDPLGLTEALGDVVAVGAPLDRRAIDDRMAEIRRNYQQSGYDQASVRAIPRLRDDGSWLVIVEVEPGVRRVLQEVQFGGLRHINPRYLRPGLQLADGDLLNVFAVDESAIRIANFAPVERLEVTTRPTGAGGSVVDFDVFEKPRWTVEFGLGWDNDRGVEVRSGLRDDNLFGRGVGANLRLRWNDIERAALFIGSLPPLPGSRISLGGTLGYREEDRALELPNGGALPYRELETLTSVELNYQVWPGTTLKPYLRYTRTRYDYEQGNLDIDLDYAITTTTPGVAAFLDRFDNPFDPRSGYGLVTDVGWTTSYLGSDVDTLQANVSGSLALEPRRGWTWLQTARFGVAQPLMGTVLDPAVRLRAGGQGSVRGFDRDSLGPVGVGGETRGGGALFILNQELRVPVWRSFRGAVFTDVGQVWESWGAADSQLSMAVGLGLRWSTPIGLVWGDVAWPVANVANSSRDPKFYLGLGRPF